MSFFIVILISLFAARAPSQSFTFNDIPFLASSKSQNGSPGITNFPNEIVLTGFDTAEANLDGTYFYDPSESTPGGSSFWIQNTNQSANDQSVMGYSGVSGAWFAQDVTTEFAYGLTNVAYPNLTNGFSAHFISALSGSVTFVPTNAIATFFIQGFTNY